MSTVCPACSSLMKSTSSRAMSSQRVNFKTSNGQIILTVVLWLESVSVVIQPAWQGDLNSTPSEPQTGLKASSGHRQPALHDNASDLKREMWWKRFSYQAFRSKKLLLTVLYRDSDTNHLCARSIDLVLINQHDESISLLGLKFYFIFFFKVSLQQPYRKQTKKSFQEVRTDW